MRSSSTALILCSLALAACAKKKEDAPAPAPSSVEPAASAPLPQTQGEAAATGAKRPLRGTPKSFMDLPTSPADAFEANDEKQIAELEKAVEADPKSIPRLRMLSASLHARATRKEDLDGVQRALDVLAKAIALAPTNGALYLDRANIELTLHQFDKAKADVAKGTSLGAPPDDGIAEQLAWNAADYDRAIALIHAATDRHRTMWTEAHEAQLHHDLGQELAADRSYELAEDLINDTNPLPVAWLDTQRGIHDVGFGRVENAIECFREAQRRVAGYAPASEQLGKVLRIIGKDAEAQSVEAALPPKTAARYDELLAKHPEATYAAAGEFFLGPGKDPKRAVDLFTKNLAISPNSASLVALARAQLAVGDDAAARANIDKALAMPLVNATLEWTAARAYAKVDGPKSKAFADKAISMNEYIKAIEPPITR